MHDIQVMKVLQVIQAMKVMQVMQLMQAVEVIQVMQVMQVIQVIHAVKDFGYPSPPTSFSLFNLHLHLLGYQPQPLSRTTQDYSCFRI